MHFIHFCSAPRISKASVGPFKLLHFCSLAMHLAAKAVTHESFVTEENLEMTIPNGALDKPLYPLLSIELHNFYL